MNKFLAITSILMALVFTFTLIAKDTPSNVSPTIQTWEYQVFSPQQLANLKTDLTIQELQDKNALAEREQKALNALNKLGSEGWELFLVENDYFYFKRLKTSG